MRSLRRMHVGLGSGVTRTSWQDEAPGDPSCPTRFLDSSSWNFLRSSSLFRRISSSTSALEGRRWGGGAAFFDGRRRDR